MLYSLGNLINTAIISGYPRYARKRNLVGYSILFYFSKQHFLILNKLKMLTSAGNIIHDRKKKDTPNESH